VSRETGGGGGGTGTAAATFAVNLRLQHTTVGDTVLILLPPVITRDGDWTMMISEDFPPVSSVASAVASVASASEVAAAAAPRVGMIGATSVETTKDPTIQFVDMLLSRSCDDDDDDEEEENAFDVRDGTDDDPPPPPPPDTCDVVSVVEDDVDVRRTRLGLYFHAESFGCVTQRLLLA